MTPHQSSLLMRLRSMDDQAEFAAGLSVFSDRQRGPFGRGSDFAVRPAQLDAAAANARLAVRDAVAAYDAGRITLTQLEDQLGEITSVTPMTVKELDALGASLTRLREAARVKEFDESPGTLPLPPLRDLGITPTAGLSVGPVDLTTWEPTVTIEGMDPSQWAQKQADAADRFSDTVINAGLGFADTLVKGIQTGDLGSIVSGLFGAGGSIIGAIPGIGTVGTILGGLLPIFGNLLGGLFGGGSRDAAEGARASGAATRGAPAIDLSIIINQSLSVQSLTDPAGRSAVNSLLLDTVRRIEDTITRNVIPRLNALDGSTA